MESELEFLEYKVSRLTDSQKFINSEIQTQQLVGWSLENTLVPTSVKVLKWKHYLKPVIVKNTSLWDIYNIDITSMGSITSVGSSALLALVLLGTRPHINGTS